MVRALQLSLLLLASGFAVQDAEACSCLPPTIQSSFNNNDHAFAARPLSEIVFGGYRIFQMEVTHPGNTCRRRGSLVTVGTPVDGATCGTGFNLGDNYLVFASDTTVGGFTAMMTNSCSGNRLVSSLTRSEIDWLRHREVSCSGQCMDPTIQMYNCLVDPCSVAPRCPDGTCEANYCGGCNAEFYDGAGYQVCIP